MQTGNTEELPRRQPRLNSFSIRIFLSPGTQRLGHLDWYSNPHSYVHEPKDFDRCIPALTHWFGERNSRFWDFESGLSVSWKNLCLFGIRSHFNQQEAFHITRIPMWNIYKMKWNLTLETKSFAFVRMHTHEPIFCLRLHEVPLIVLLHSFQ